MSDNAPRYRLPGRFLATASVIALMCALPFLFEGRWSSSDTGPGATPPESTASPQDARPSNAQPVGADDRPGTFSLTRLLPTNSPFDPFGLGNVGLRESAAGDDASSEARELSHALPPQHARVDFSATLRTLAFSNAPARYPALGTNWRSVVQLGVGAGQFFSSTEWGYLLPAAYSYGTDPQTASSLRLKMPPLFLDPIAAMLGDYVIGGIDYTDPSELGTPLLWVRRYEELQISPHFRVRDFATRDGAPLARISTRLVAALERLAERAAPVHIISGYRHITHNAFVGGATRSHHLSGEAADIWSSSNSSVPLARHVVESIGCGIGLGLGPSSLHVDVRGSLTTWTYRGAPLGETMFGLWIRMLCRNTSSDLTWPAERIDWRVQDSLRIYISGDNPDDNPDELQESLWGWTLDVHQEFATLAAAFWEENGPGAVVIDTRSGGPTDERALEDMASYVGLQPWEILQPDIHTLIDEIAEDDSLMSFVYVALRDDGSLAYGLLDYERETGDTGLEPAEQDVTSNWGWTLVVASTPDSTEANTLAAGFHRTFAETGLQVVPRPDSSASPIRYLITVGHFPTAFDAREARQAHARIFPRNTWLMPVGR